MRELITITLFGIILLIIAGVITISQVVDVVDSLTGRTIIVAPPTYELPSVDDNSSNRSDQLFRRQTIILAQVLAEGEQIGEMDTGVDELGNLSSVFYTGSIIVGYLSPDFTLVKDTSKTTRIVYDVKFVEDTINDIVPLYNEMVYTSKSVGIFSTDEDLETYLNKVGHLGGKILYLAVRTDAVAASKFIEGSFEMARLSNIDVKNSLGERCGVECVNAYDILIPFLSETIDKALNISDRVLYELCGFAGEKSMPIILKTTTISEETLQYTILPEAEKLGNDIMKNMIESVNK